MQLLGPARNFFGEGEEFDYEHQHEHEQVALVGCQLVGSLRSRARVVARLRRVIPAGRASPPLRATGVTDPGYNLRHRANDN